MGRGSLARFLRLLHSLLSAEREERIDARLRLTEVATRFTLEPFRHFALRARGYRAPPLSPTLRHRRSRLYLTRDGASVLKRVRCDTKQGIRLRRLLRDPDERDRYHDALRASHRLPFLGAHFDEVGWIGPDGSYQTQWHQGPILSELWRLTVSNGSLPEDVAAPALREALCQLRRNIERYAADHKFLVGDWAMHNLVFDTRSETITNVDSEGVYSNPGSPSTLETSPVYVGRWIESLERLIDVTEGRGASAQDMLDVLRLAGDVKRKRDALNGRLYPAGYHTLNLRGVRFHGQRDCESRLRSVPYDFRGRTVLELGCAVGGMLHAVAGSIHAGIGIDPDFASIRLAASVAHLNEWSHLRFRRGDPRQHSLESLAADITADIIFLLSPCRWPSNGTEVVRWCSDQAPALLLETQGTHEQQAEPEKLARQRFRTLVLVAGQADDDPSRPPRRLHLCEH